ncbi:protein kinase [Gymnopilus junonius]|uniref:non-specific serine/threonine protein kinase n=1 Tax=Gymnopilus junonius TaxID=109634 RepID=A0A9P5TG26_GYMJU|nr:protein kinase [Gymnopilus junonius]
MARPSPTRSFQTGTSSEELTRPAAFFKELPADATFEEEEIPEYDSKDFYPVRLGEVFNSRYQVIAKQGFGTSSTVWFDGAYLTLKVCILAKDHSVVTPQSENEVATSRHLKEVCADHEGHKYVRTVQDDFVVTGPYGQHRCLIYKPLGMTYTQFRNLHPDRLLDQALVQQIIQLIFMGLDYLHKGDVVHTDISPNNILMGVEDSDMSVFSVVEQTELEQPAPRKTLRDHTIYLSRPTPLTKGPPVLCDLGCSRIGKKHTGDVMPDFYRAPEVILGMEWDSKVDIWSMGIWDLFEGGRLFYALKDRMLNDEQHLAEMVSLLGPPPKEFLQRSEKCRQYWDSEGNWIAKTEIPEQSFEMREYRLQGKDKELLMAFVRSVLRWLPEERPTAEDLIWDEWLMQPYLEKPGL